MKPAVRTALIAITASVAFALVGCSAVQAPSNTAAATATENIQPVTQVEETAAANSVDDTANSTGCAALEPNRIDYLHQSGGGPIFAELRHELVDQGSSAFAQGDVTLNEDGDIHSYTVAAGDSPIAIGDRFCIDYITVLQYNHTWPQIDPGELLILRPDPTVQWGDDTPVEGEPS